MKKSRKILIALPLILGILSFLTFLIYFYSANHAPYDLIQVIYAGPMLSLAGVIISIITRKSRKACPTLWTSGFAVCLLSLAVCLLIIFLLAWIVFAMFNGDWL